MSIEANADPSLTSKSDRCSAILDHRLLLYTIAAGAAMVGATSSSAEVLFTPSKALLHGPIAKLDIDLDHDGLADFQVALKPCLSASGYQTIGCLKVYGASPSNEVVADVAHDVAALRIRGPISSGRAFLQSCYMGTAFGYHFNWCNVTNRFLGVRFLVNGEVHFGWIGFRHVDGFRGKMGAALAGWAYETQPDKSIGAGDMGSSENGATIQPTSLEILSAGYSGVEQRRKRVATAGGHQ
jgi:hypothetical protein